MRSAANDHICDEEAIRHHTIRGGAPIKGIVNESPHVPRQSPVSTYGIPRAILEDVAQPLTVWLAKAELGPGDVRLRSECIIDDVECGSEIGVLVEAGTRQGLLLVPDELLLSCQGFIVAV